jgi:hypothetical protein
MLRKEPSYLQMFVYPNNRGQRGEDTHQEASARRSRSKQSRSRARFNSREKKDDDVARAARRGGPAI